MEKEFDYCVHWVVWSYFQQLIVKVRSRSGKKGPIFNFIDVNKKGAVQIRCRFSSEIRWCPLLCYTTCVPCSNMYLNYKHFSILCIQKNEMSYKSTICWHIKVENFQYWFILMGSITYVPNVSANHFLIKFKNIFFWKFVK